MSAKPNGTGQEWRVVRLLAAYLAAGPIVAIVLGVSVRLFLMVSGIGGGQ